MEKNDQLEKENDVPKVGAQIFEKVWWEIQDGRELCDCLSRLVQIQWASDSTLWGHRRAETSLGSHIIYTIMGATNENVLYRSPCVWIWDAVQPMQCEIRLCVVCSLEVSLIRPWAWEYMQGAEEKDSGNSYLGWAPDPRESEVLAMLLLPNTESYSKNVL